jgi:hypothetical protein
MKKRFFLLLLLIGFCKISKAQFVDDFNDGDYISNPTWNPSAPSDFTVVAGQLKSANTTTNTNFYISTTNTLAVDCQWDFYTNLQFNTSSANYVDIYIVSDNVNLQSANINGYFVRIGGTADEICLYRRSGTLAGATKIIDGADGITNIPNNTLKIKVIRTTSNQFTLERDITGTGNNYVSEGSFTDATHITTSAFGFYIQQSTGSFIQRHIFDDVYVGPIIYDIAPPQIVSTTATSSISVDVLFNENLDLISSETAANYLVSSGIGQPTAATRDVTNPKLVHLDLLNPLTSGNSYSITVNNVQDLAGNPCINAVSSFSFLQVGVPVFKDIIINEIFADPSPVVNLTTCEFIELYNKGSVAFNLNGLKLTDNSGLATIGNYILPSGGYVIICPIADTAQFTALGYTNKIGVSSFPSLNNDNDNIYLKDAANNFIDSVRYKDSWYGSSTKKDGGFTLELINPNLNVACSEDGNWIGSTNLNGGTPGFINSVYSIAPDLIGPKISGISIIDSVSIKVCFNDVISSTQLSVLTNYNINNSIGAPTTALINGNCVTLTLSQKLVNATNYTLTVNGLTDCNANTVSPNTESFSFYKHKPYDVVINELMPDPDPFINLPNEEFVELKNKTPFNINLKNWSFSSLTTTKLLPDVTIKPDSFIVLTSSGNANAFGDYYVSVTEVSGFPSLLNSGTTLTLKDSLGKVVHTITYSSSWYQDDNKKDGGWSLEQIDPNNPCGGIENWRASMDINGGTPGKRNSVLALNPDIIIPKLERIYTINADTIVLVFNEPLDNLSLNNPNSYGFDNGLTQPTYIEPLLPDYKKVKIKLSNSIQAGIIYNCTILSDVKDCVGNLIPVGQPIPFALPEPMVSGDVIINEILFDPNTSGIDFVEIYNRSNKVVDLNTLYIGSMDTISGQLKDTETIINEGYLFYPQNYLVLSEDGKIVKQQYATTNPNGFLNVIDLPSMNTTDDVVILSDTNGVVIDNLVYTNKMHFPLLVSTKGVSLERIDFNRPTKDKTNWNSASEGVGFATPAYQNSQYLKADGGSGFAVESPIFSPDNDGYQDVLNITYKLDEPGKSANIYIYDNKGRQITHLVKNQQLAQDGVISWNGINEANEKAAIGVYVIYIETFSLSGKLNKYKLTCTLAGRL